MKKLILLILGSVVFGNVVAQQNPIISPKKVPMVAPVAIDSKSIGQKDLKKVAQPQLLNNKNSLGAIPEKTKSLMVITSQPKNNMINGVFDKSKLVPKPLKIENKKLTGNETLDDYNKKRVIFLRKKAEVKRLMGKKLQEENRKKNALLLQEMEQEKKWKEFEAKNPKVDMTREKMIMMEAARGKTMPSLPPLGKTK